MAAGNRWGRAVGAAVLGEFLLLVVVLATGIAIKKFELGPRSASLDALLHASGSWITSVGGPIVAFLAAHWALRQLTSRHMAHALVVAVVAVALHVLVFYGMNLEWGWKWQFRVSAVLMVVACVLAARLGQRSAPPIPDERATTSPLFRGS